MAATTPRWRRVLSMALAVVAGLAAPLAIVADWTAATLTDTETFVGRTSALAREPAVQQAVVARTTEAIIAGIGVEDLTRQALESLAGGEDASGALGRLLPSLSGPLTQAVQEFVHTQVTRFVQSDQAAALWDGATRQLHQQALALLQSDEAPNVVLADGQLQLRIGPFVDAARTRLVDQGFSIARFIPDSQATVALVAVDPAAVARARGGYRALTGLAVGLPVLALVAVVGAVAFAPDRWRGLSIAAVAVTAGCLLLAVALWLGSGAVAAQLTAAGFEPPAPERIVTALVGDLQALSLVGVGVGLVAAVAGLLLARGGVLDPRRHDGGEPTAEG